MSGSHMAQKLTFNTDMKVIYICEKFEWYEGEILYTFIPSFKVEDMMPQVMNDHRTLMVWLSDSHNSVVASKADILNN